jgi:hypothetical protein
MKIIYCRSDVALNESKKGSFELSIVPTDGMEKGKSRLPSCKQFWKNVFDLKSGGKEENWQKIFKELS